jgi:outer membrane protein TolC
LLPGFAGAGSSDPAALTLEEAERLALAQDPLIGRFQHLEQARREQAVADGQLPDPQLKLGLLNFPTDTFSRSQEPMTQVLVGVSQRFPRGDTLSLQQRQTEARADADSARARERRRAVLRATRQAWLELYLQERSAQVIQTSRGLFNQLAEITEDQYAAGRSNQQDVLQAQLELTQLEDRYTRTLLAADQARAELARWLGVDAQRPLSLELRLAPQSPDLEVLRQGLPTHPALDAENAQITEKRIGSEIAREQYKPGWMLDLSYANRIGSNADGSSRSDFASAIVQVDLPLFPDKRQDRRLEASQQEAIAATGSRDDKLRELERMLEAGYAQWQRLGERQRLYSERLLPEAEAHAQAALRAYQTGVSEFITLMRARIAELDARLEALRLEVERAKLRAALSYLEEEPV